MTKKTIGKGAEAVIYLDTESNAVIKERPVKAYRLKEIDDKLRKFRTRREAKIIEKLSGTELLTPKLLMIDDKNAVIKMEFIEGPKLRDVLEKKDYKKLCEEVGFKVGIMHNKDIMHADLTTSNMILNKEGIYFIDFGLSFFSAKTEDRAVDLHLMKQALESKHYKIFEECFAYFIKGYKKTAKNSQEVIARLETVEKRGRYKH